MGAESLSAGEVAPILVRDIVCKYGVPESLLHDRDPRFTAEL